MAANEPIAVAINNFGNTQRNHLQSRLFHRARGDKRIIIPHTVPKQTDIRTIEPTVPEAG